MIFFDNPVMCVFIGCIDCSADSCVPINQTTVGSLFALQSRRKWKYILSFLTQSSASDLCL